VKTKVGNYLKSVMYHNLPKVRVLYQAVFRFDIFQMLRPNGTAVLMKAIEYRHDCVHRNGFDKNGNRLDVFTSEYIENVGNEMRALVDRIEQENNPISEDLSF
jgi:hypothetical protein